LRNTTEALLQVGCGGFVVLCNHNATAVGAIKQNAEPEQFRPHRSGKQDDRAREGGDGMVHAIQIRALCNDAQLFVHCQYLGGTCTENRLRISQNDLVHDVRLICLLSPLSL
jgi:hypothetical protein